MGETDFDRESWTFDCRPTMTDAEVLAFCRDGCLLLPGVVPDRINRRACDWLDGAIPAEPSFVPDGMTQAEMDRIRASHEPSTIFLEDWFIEHVLLNPQVAGVMRSLLGPAVGLPILASLHRVECPAEAGSWHQDADCVFGPELHFVEVFYFPQDTPAALGPTEIVPGSHLARFDRSREPEGGVAGGGPAGTIGIHHQSILHRRGPSAASGSRRMLKYNYWRTSAPRRDWRGADGFDPRTADYGGHFVARYVAHMFAWLAGKGDEYRVIGGQGWPWRTPNQLRPSYGYAAAGGYAPDWRKGNADGYAQ